MTRFQVTLALDMRVARKYGCANKPTTASLAKTKAIPAKYPALHFRR
jgi:hypothetical protein